MTFSCPSFLAAAISAFMPPPWATEVTFDQFVARPAPRESPEQPAASTAALSATATRANDLWFRTIALRARDGGQRGQNQAIAAMAAPTMPASFCSAAGTTRALSVSLGRNLSDFLLMPPPMMIRSGEIGRAHV